MIDNFQVFRVLLVLLALQLEGGILVLVLLHKGTKHSYLLV